MSIPRPQPVSFDDPCGRSRCRGGFTLLELVVSILAASVLMVGLSSALYLSIQATEPDIGGHESKLEGGSVLADFVGELQMAQSFTVRDATTVEFTVADRDNDASAETIRWEWSGVAGDPLTRRYNAGSTVDVLKNVHDFQLSYQIDTVTTYEESSGATSSEEMLFASFEGWDGITPSYLSQGLGTAAWAAEYFPVTGLPSDLTSMTITRAAVRLQQNTGGNVQLSVHKPVSGGIEPQATAIGSAASVSVSSLPTSFDWVEFTFSDVTVDGLQEEFVLVLKGTVDNAAYAEKLYSYSAPADAQVMLYTSDSGGSWGPSAYFQNRYDMQFRVWGTYATNSATEEPVTRYFVVAGDVALQAGDDAANRIETATTILNRPEVSGL